jgi:2-(1,2-epoxy-1,2-dihydrophenyl)acetyl-CoA isomerase
MPEVDTGTPDLRFTIDDGVAVLTLSRPERRNALSVAMLEALRTALTRVAADPSVGCVVLTGAGGAFCAGGDVKGFATDTGPRAPFEQRLQMQRTWHREIALRLYELPKPTVAILPGAAAGAGLSIALACDLRYASTNAVLTTAFARVGLAGDFGGTWLLTQLVGPSKARELYYFSPRVDAAEALRLGLLNEVFAEADLVAEALGRARRLAHGPTVALRYMKENLNRAVTHDFADCLDQEAVHHLRVFDTDDHREAVTAFMEKRDPVFGASREPVK